MDAAETIAALVALTEQEREVVIARVWGGLTFQQIATVMEISTSTAHRRYVESLADLRRRMRLPWLTK